jgi:hypothetical protein
LIYLLAERNKKHFIDFFKRLFSLYEDDKVSFDDGYYKVDFQKPPKCASIDTYDFKYIPIVLVGIGSIQAVDTGIDKFRDYYLDPTSGETQAIYGGSATININFTIRASSSDERNSLADLVTMYLNNRATKQEFGGTFGIRIIGAPSQSGENAEDDTQTNTKIFSTEISQTIEVDYEENIDLVDSFGNIGTTVQSIMSYLSLDVYNYIKVRKDAGDTDGEVIALLETRYNLSTAEATAYMDRYNAGEFNLEY